MESSTPFNLKVHPAADLFPLIVGPEFDELVADIRAHGVREPIWLYEGKILDGRNRERAALAAGVECPTRTYDGDDPVSFVLSANLHRRHLTAEQKRDLIAKLLKAQPESSDRAIAKTVTADHKTVGHVRRELEATGEIPQLTETVGADGKTRSRAAVPAEIKGQSKSGNIITLKTHRGEEVPYPLPQGKAKFNRTNDQVSWAAWTWNPVTGCLHGCAYCYARELASKKSSEAAYPVGFTPLFHHERLEAPSNTSVPDEAQSDPRLKRVFVCSMADLYGKWVPDDWIKQVHASCIDNPQWDYLMLTKFPRRYVGLDLPKTAWLGATVDEQKRVRLAEEAFRQIKNVRVKWLSLEPLLAPLEFTDLSMFDWIVIGSQSETKQPDGVVKGFAPPFEWVSRIVAQARECGCRVYLKPNLLGIPNSQSMGMQLPQEEPQIADLIAADNAEAAAA
jgi:protein gp37